MIKKSIESICVFCASRDGFKIEFKEASIELGYLIAKNKLKLIYGGGQIGLMGSLASSAQKNNCNITGVIPEHLKNKELANTSLKNLIVTRNMHERKQLMYQNSDAFIVLPGGVGTLDEFYEILTWAQLELHTKPIILINIEYFWSPLITLLKHQTNSGFVDKKITQNFLIVETPKEAIDYIIGLNRDTSRI